MELLERMKRRRSIRRYQERQIPREALEQVLDAGSWAPTPGAASTPCWTARCFVLLVYCAGEYRAEKPRKAGRIHIAE